MAAPIHISMAGKKRKLVDLSMEEFMTGGFESSSSESDRRSLEKKTDKKTKMDKKKKGSKQKKSLKERLKEQDPEFYEFLAEEDQSLLEMDDDISDNDDLVSDDDDDDVSDDSDDDDSSDEDIRLPESSDDETEIPKKKGKSLKTDNTDKLNNKKSKTLKNKTEKSKQHEVTKEQKKTETQTQKEKKKMSEKESGNNEIAKEGSNNIKKKKKDKTTKEDDKMTNKEKKKRGMEKKQITKESDSENDDDLVGFDDIEAEDSGSDDDDGLHKPPEKLEVMTDSEDDEEESVKKSGKVKVTMKMVADWTRRFKELPSPALLHETVYAFKAAVQQTASEEVPTKYKVIGSKVFNAVIRMCLVEIPQAVHRILDLPSTTDFQKPVLPSSKNQKWKKVRLDVKSYLADVLQLLSNLSQANMIDVLLKHIHRMVVFYACFPGISKVMLKKVITIWSTGEETSRVLAFLCINRLIRLQQDTMLEPCFKQIYMAYVKNCKFTSPNALPLINFMQRSLVEVLSLDFALAYQYAFIYIRQLAIHLRNAITTKKKESCQAVYNWQFIHCLGLWVRLLSLTHPNEVLEPLIYPLTQTIIGTIKLVPTQRYYPLRFHCVRYLTTLSKSTGTFIPVLPFLLEIDEVTLLEGSPQLLSKELSLIDNLGLVWLMDYP